MEVRFVITLLVAIIRSISSYEKCATEYYDFKNDLIKWDSTNGSVVISNPPCLDERGRYVMRECIKGVWEPKAAPTCYSIATSNRLCPQGFIEINNSCITVSEPKTFDQLCPFPGIRYYNYSYINSSSQFWFPLKKFNGVYIYTSIDKRYGREYKINVKNVTSDCFVIKSGDYHLSDCNSLQRHICVYRATIFDKLHSRLFTSINSSNEVRLELKFDQNREKVLLTVYSPEHVIKKMDDDDDEYAVYCFTDASMYEMKSRVKKKEIFNSLKYNRTDIIQHLIVYEIPIKLDNAGQYWCEAYNISESSIKSNMIVAYKKRKGNEYALRAILENACGNSTDCSRITTEIIYKFLDQVYFKTIFYGLNVVVRVMKIYGKINETDIDVLLHLSTPRQSNVIGEYYKLLRFFETIHQKSISVVYFRSSEVCIAETRDNLTWKVTNLWNKATPKEFCIDDDGMPVVRSCLGDFLEGAYWSDDYNKCADDQYDSVSNKTLQLYEMTNSNDTANNITCAIKNLTTNAEDLSVLDIYFVASTIYNVSTKVEEESDIDNLVETIGHVLESDGDALKRAQLVLNATDTILDSIDTFLQEDFIISNITNEVFMIRKDKFLVHITKPFLSNVSGLAIYSNNDSVFDVNEIINIHLNETFENITMHNLDLSVYVPNSLLETFLDTTDDRNSLTIITTVHFNDKLFNSESDVNETIFGHVISVTIPNYGIFLQEPIPLLFRNNDEGQEENHCAFWEYGMNSPNKIGHWSGLGGSNIDINESNYSKCSFTHLTHFALLIMSQKMFIDEVANVTDITEVIAKFNAHDDALNVITVMGCILSLVGISGIFLTAACIKRWRQKAGSKILLQLSVTISLEIIVIQIAGAEFTPNKTLSCKIVGICLHYVVLSKFSWMFVSAILQYIRFVKVFAVTPPRLVLKAMLFGWCMPLIPVIAVVCISTSSYGVGAQKFCYPTGWGLYLGLFAPIVFIVVANLIVFTLVMKNVFQDRMERRGKAKDSQKRQFYLGILLFFMLGVPWVFGILAEMVKHTLLQLIFMYLFCLTATLQGCVLFVFYVILDRETRNLWAALL